MMELLFSLNPQAAAPLHRQLYSELRQAILSGQLSAGQKVPSTRALAQSLGVSRATVTLTYEYLLSEGYLQAFTGAGTFVSRELPENLLEVEPEEVEHVYESKILPAVSEDEVLQALGNGVDTRGTRARKPSDPPAKHKKLSSFGRHLSEGNDWLRYSEEEPEIQFSLGRPDLDEFPMRLWMQLSNNHAKTRDLSLLDCPTPTRAQGYLPLRKALAEYVARSRAVHCKPEQIIIVNGSQQAIDLVTRVLIDRGDYAGVEEPGYPGAKKALLAQGATLVPFHVDNQGLRLDELKSRFAVSSDNPLKLIYVTPSHQYPTGVVLSLARRLEMLSWAQRTGSYIIEDDYDSEYRYKGRPIPALAALDKDGSVIYIGTFSKVLLPALRLGYLVVPETLIPVFARAKWLADRHSPLLQQQVLAEFISEGHLERHVRKMRSVYERKRRLFVETLKRYFGDRISIHGDNAGINMLVRFDSIFEDPEIVSRAEKANLGITSTSWLYLENPRRGEFLLNYGGLSEEKIVEGVRRLATIMA